ncbi:MAG: response regulator [Spirochaetales bacterium]|nr:response regulator [Spirochaetales bacterium]
MNDKARILIAEDEVIVGLVLRNTVKAMGHEVVAVVRSGREVVEFAREECVDLILMDVRLSDDVDGISAAEAINRDIPIIFQTAYVDEGTIDRARSLNPIAVLEKPVGDRVLRATIERGLSARSG